MTSTFDYLLAKSAIINRIDASLGLGGGNGGGDYSSIYFVSPTGNNGTAQANDLTLPYATVNAAADAARTEFVSSKVRTLVFVFEGTFNEGSIARNGVDMYFADKTVVWHTTTSIINDLHSSLSSGGGSFNIFGKGTFATLQANTVTDRNTINIKYSTTAYIQAKDIGDLMQWNGTSSRLIVEDATIRMRVNVQTNNQLILRKCILLSPIFSIANISNTLTRLENCTIRLLSNYAYGVTAALWSITDTWNATTISFVDPATISSSYLTEYQTGDASNTAVVSNYNIVNTRQSFVACVEISSTIANGSNFEFYNCIFQIERLYCIGVLILQSIAASSDQRAIFKGCVVRDISTSRGDTLGILEGKASSVTTEMETDLTGISVSNKITVDKKLWGTYRPLTGGYNAHQKSEILEYLNYTTDATANVVLGTISLRASSTYQIDVVVVGGETDATPTEYASYKLIGTYNRIGTGNVNLIGSVDTIHSSESTGSMDCNLNISTTTLQIRITGVTATNMRWKAVVNLVNVGSN